MHNGLFRYIEDLECDIKLSATDNGMNPILARID